MNLNKHVGFDDVPIDIFCKRILVQKFGRASWLFVDLGYVPRPCIRPSRAPQIRCCTWPTGCTAAIACGTVPVLDWPHRRHDCRCSTKMTKRERHSESCAASMPPCPWARRSIPAAAEAGGWASIPAVPPRGGRRSAAAVGCACRWPFACACAEFRGGCWQRQMAAAGWDCCCWRMQEIRVGATSRGRTTMPRRSSGR